MPACMLSRLACLLLWCCIQDLCSPIKHAGIIFSNPMVLPDARPHPIRIPRGLTSPPRPPMAPPSEHGAPPHQTVLCILQQTNIWGLTACVASSCAVFLDGGCELTTFLYAITGGYLATMSPPEHVASGREEAATVTEGVSPQMKGSGEVSGSPLIPVCSCYK